MGNLARDVLFRMPARDVIHYSRSPALTNLMHGSLKYQPRRERERERERERDDHLGENEIS